MTLRTTTTVEICISLHWHLHLVHFPSSWNQFYCWFKFLMTCMLEMLTTFVGFTAYLLSEECDIFDPVHSDVCQDMTHPLSHYFIAASHKTFVFVTFHIIDLYFYRVLICVLVWKRFSLDRMLVNIRSVLWSCWFRERKGIWPVKILLQWQKTSGFAVINW